MGCHLAMSAVTPYAKTIGPLLPKNEQEAGRKKYGTGIFSRALHSVNHLLAITQGPKARRLAARDLLLVKETAEVHAGVVTVTKSPLHRVCLIAQTVRALRAKESSLFS